MGSAVACEARIESLHAPCQHGSCEYDPLLIKYLGIILSSECLKIVTLLFNLEGFAPPKLLELVWNHSNMDRATRWALKDAMVFKREIRNSQIRFIVIMISLLLSSFSFTVAKLDIYENLP